MFHTPSFLLMNGRYLLIKATTFPYRIPFDGQESIVVRPLIHISPFPLLIIGFQGVVDPLSAAVRVSWRNPSSQSFTPAIYVTGAGELFFTGNAGKTAKDINTNLSEVVSACDGSSLAAF